MSRGLAKAPAQKCGSSSSRQWMSQFSIWYINLFLNCSLWIQHQTDATREIPSERPTVSSVSDPNNTSETSRALSTGLPALRCRSAGGREGLRQRGATSGTSENAMVPQGIGCDWRMFMDFRGAFLLATISLIETQRGSRLLKGVSMKGELRDDLFCAIDSGK